MRKKNVYLVQVTAEYETAIMLPYSVGVIEAYALSNEQIREFYSFGRLFFKRERIEVSLASLKDPFIVGFSSSVWNSEYNKAFAKALKEKYPNCTVVFGGHNVPTDFSFLEEFSFIDFLIHGEGEEAFTNILIHFLTDSVFSDIRNISYRSTDGCFVMNEIAPPVSIQNYPSPYLTGVFDQVFESNETGYIAFFETNRGCPYPCTYCDWQTFKTGMRNFPLDRIRAEIEWIAKHKIEYCGSSDGNFGMFERDELIADWLIEMNKKTGYPKKFQVAYAKDSNMRVYRINKKLNDAGMCKGATLSLQSLSNDVLNKIGRKNMTLEKFTELLTLYERGKIPTYTEIIIGLPGETYESFCSGIGQLFEAGQHTSVIVNNCDLLVNTALASVESIEKYGIKKVSAAFSKEHCEVFPNEVQEFSDIIIATNTMENQMWVKAKLFSLFAQALHCMGLLRYFAVFLFYEKKINYADFYLQLVESFEISENSLCRQIYSDMKNRLERFSANGNALHFVDSRFGNITWPLEEGIFLELVSKSEEFFADVNNFLLSFEIEADIYYDLMKYQRNIVKLPGETNFDIELKYDFYRYFSSIFLNSYKPLEKIKNIIHVNDSNPASGWKDFAREIVWYGRKSSRNVYTDIRVKYV